MWGWFPLLLQGDLDRPAAWGWSSSPSGEWSLGGAQSLRVPDEDNCPFATASVTSQACSAPCTPFASSNSHPPFAPRCPTHLLPHGSNIHDPGAGGSCLDSTRLTAWDFLACHRSRALHPVFLVLPRPAPASEGPGPRPLCLPSPKIREQLRC